MRSPQNLAATPRTPLPELLALDRVASLLDVPPRRLRDQVRLGRIPGVVRLGNRLLLRRETLERWIADGCPRPEAMDADRRQRDAAMAATTRALELSRLAREVPDAEQLAALERVGKAIEAALGAWREIQEDPHG